MDKSLSLEQRIKKLEEQLALKTALLAVKVDFEGAKVSASIKKNITAKVIEFCAKWAEDVELGAPSAAVASNSLTEEEIIALKMLADKVLTKAIPSAPQKIVKNKAKTVAGAEKFAMLLTRDGLSPQLKKQIDSDEILKIVKHDDNQASVISKKGIRFVVPMSDLEFQDQP